MTSFTVSYGLAVAELYNLKPSNFLERVVMRNKA